MKTSKFWISTGVAGIMMAASHTAGAQTNITWGANGLPPGLSIQTVNSNTGSGRIVGTPTTAGNFTADIYTLVNGVPGDFLGVSLTVLPAGDTTPMYHTYSRSVAGNRFFPLAGGGGRVYGGVIRGLNSELYMTTNGRTFTKATLPSSAQALALRSAATAGARTMVLVGGDGFGFNPATLALVNSNGGAFTAFPLPAGSTNYGGQLGVVADGASVFYLYRREMTYSGVSSAVLTIWSAGSSWTQRGVFTNTNGSYGSAFPHFAKSTNNVSLLTGQGMLLRSTNNGANWSRVASAPVGIGAVAFGNGNFLATAADGFYRSAGNSGTNWTKVSSQPSNWESLAFTNNTFFSNYLGTSRDGSFWVPYNEGGGIGGNYSPSNPYDSSPVVLGGSSSLIFANLGQASTVFVPSFFKGSQRANVGTAVNIPLQTD